MRKPDRQTIFLGATLVGAIVLVGDAQAFGIGPDRPPWDRADAHTVGPAGRELVEGLPEKPEVRWYLGPPSPLRRLLAVACQAGS